MSYVLGFVVADGCIGIKRITKRNGIKQYYFNITSKDKSHLENIQKAMGAGQKIYSKSNGFAGEKKYYAIQIGHQEICNDLISLGIHPRKTYNLDPINVPSKYFPDFVRGFFDGDGSVYIYKVNGVSQIKSGFVSPNLEFIKDLNKNICKCLDIPRKNIHENPPKREDQTLMQYTNCFYIDDSERLYKFMYRHNPTLYLLRKREIFERWTNIKRRHYIKKNYPSKIGWHLNKQLT